MGLEALPLLLDSVRPVNYEPWWSSTYRRAYSALPLAWRRHLPAPLDLSAELAFQGLVARQCDELWPESGPLLIKTLRHPRAEVRVTAALALRPRTNRPPEVLNALTNSLTDPDSEVRLYGVVAIASFGARASNAVPVIVDNLLSRNRPAHFRPSENEQACAAMTLGKIGPGAVMAVPVLQAGAAQRTNTYFRVTSAIALWEIRHQVPDALPALMQEFRGSFDPLKPMILDCLGEMGAQAAEAVPGILGLLASTPNPNDFEDDLSRQKARAALLKIAPDVANKWEHKAEKQEP